MLVSLTTQIPAGRTAVDPTATTGRDFGHVRCNKVFGRGVQENGFTVKPATTTTGVVSGPFKDYFNRGTIHGTYKLHYSVASTGVTTYTGTTRTKGGTGAFKGIRGSTKVKCTSTDGVHTTCHSRGHVRRS